MQIVKGIAFEPVGCLAEFRAEEFDELSVRLFNVTEEQNRTGSEAYWHWLNWMEKTAKQLDRSEREIAEGLELKAVDRAELYEDVVPALTQLKEMGIQMLISSSLSNAAVNRFLERSSLTGLFSSVWTRDNAEGVKAVPLRRAIEDASFKPEQVMYLVDTIEGLNVASDVGANSILMVNDYEDGRRLAMHHPTGGIVSLHELPDFIRLVAENAESPVQS